MTTYGVTETGFVAKPYDVILDEWRQAFLAAFGADVGDTVDEIIGELMTIGADRESSIWDLGEAIYLAGTPDGAAGVPLIDLAAITGTLVEPATRSTAPLYCIGDIGTRLGQQQQAAVSQSGSPDVVFVIKLAENEDAELKRPDAWAANTRYFYGQYALGADDNLYVCQSPGHGTSGSTVPSGTGVGISDGGVVWDYVDDLTLGVHLFQGECDQFGPVTADVGTLSVIATPVEGWRKVFNPDMATIGQLREPDTSLRLRREAELAGGANGTIDAIRARLLKIGAPAVATVETSENDSDYAIGDAPPHSFTSVIRSGVESPPPEFADTVARTLWESKPAGIQTYGDQSGLATDASGEQHRMRWYTPSTTDIWVFAQLKVGSAVDPAILATTLFSMLEAVGDNYAAGSSVYADELVEQIRGLREGLGIVSVLGVKLGLSEGAINQVELDMPAVAELHRPKIDRSRIFLCPNWLAHKGYAVAGEDPPSYVAGGGAIWKCISAGTSGGTEPSWAGTGTISDGGVTWQWLRAVL